jgi:hypothetical protein
VCRVENQVGGDWILRITKGGVEDGWRRFGTVTNLCDFLCSQLAN